LKNGNTDKWALSLAFAIERGKLQEKLIAEIANCCGKMTDNYITIIKETL
jgi:hypothetical protein